MARLPVSVPPGQLSAAAAACRRAARAWLLPLACCLAPAGCVSVGTWLHPGERPPTGPVTQTAAMWDPHVTFTPDVMHGGTPTPGLAGRLYLVGPADGDVRDGAPRVGDGALTVLLYNDDAVGGGGGPALLEYWQIDHDKLKLFLHKDMFGWGYSLFLPLSRYDPAIKHVHMMVCYQPRQGTPVYTPSRTLTLQGADEARPVVTSKTILPGASQAPAPAPGPAAPPGPAPAPRPGLPPPPPGPAAPPPAAPAPAAPPGWPAPPAQVTPPAQAAAPSQAAAWPPVPVPARPPQFQQAPLPVQQAQYQAAAYQPAPLQQAPSVPPPPTPPGARGAWVWQPNP
jgi:hypothetical protein